MTNIDFQELPDIINKLVIKYYGDSLCWFDNVIFNDDDTYVIDIKFREDFILKMQAHDFAMFRTDVYRAVDKLFIRSGCKVLSATCSAGCHGCGGKQSKERVYKIQFSEEIK